ncbi:MAG: hypothetical protein IKB60_02420 [Clostridia bacterium]|nr:hypothetical protein [Clostridia bacterium]
MEISMRNYIPKKNNMYRLPHNTYMQMFYLLRDYTRIKKENIWKPDSKKAYGNICRAIDETSLLLEADYQKRSTTYGKLDPYKAFFDYSYFSYMFARKRAEVGASKSAWSLYKSKFAYMLAENLRLV